MTRRSIIGFSTSLESRLLIDDLMLKVKFCIRFALIIANIIDRLFVEGKVNNQLRFL